AANPSALIVSPPFNGGDKKITASMDGFFSAGGGQYVDVIAFHGYLGAYGVPSVAENILHITQAVKAKVAQYSLSDKPIFDTEGSWGPNDNLTGDDARVAFVARYYLLHASEGIARMYWFSWGDYDYGELFSTAKGLEPAGVAYGVVESWLVGAS